jgi:guanosine-3',5'-bis(diphosphate) 3'-pyrophosphohydrolase
LLQFAELRNQLAEYLTKEQVELVAKAFAMAEASHSGQQRSSGDPYITHPLLSLKSWPICIWIINP